LELLERNKDVILHHAAVEVKQQHDIEGKMGQQMQAISPPVAVNNNVGPGFLVATLLK